MSTPLRQLTNTYTSTPKLQKESSIQSDGIKENLPQDLPDKIEDLLSINLKEIDFGECLPKTVLERKLSITLKKTLPVAKIISLLIVCEDQELNELPEYIFGIRKESSFQYFDEFKFKASQKGIYSFMIGVKTPCLQNYPINCRLLVTMQNFPISLPIIVNLRQIAKIPSIACTKELLECEGGHRVIKLSVMKNKKGKQIRLPFRFVDNMQITLIGDIIGIEEGKPVLDLKPKTLQLSGKGQFFISLMINYTEQLNKKLQQLEKNAVNSPNFHSLRKILIFRIKDTNYHYHFPLDISFYPSSSSSKGQQTNSIE